MILDNSILYNKELKPIINTLIYEPLRTIRECNLWAETFLRIPHVNYTGFDINLANRINRQIQIMKNLYPEVETIRWVDDITRSVQFFAISTQTGKDLLNKYDNNIQGLIEDFSYGAIAITLKEDCKYKGMWFNLEDMKDAKIIEKKFKIGVKAKHFPVGTLGVENTVTHEFAHHIEDFLVSRNLFGYMEKIWKEQHKNIKNRKKRRLRAKKTIKKKLCKYGAENISEFFCEGIDEYIHNPEPRELAMRIGKETQSVFDTFRLQNTAK